MHKLSSQKFRQLNVSQKTLNFALDIQEKKIYRWRAYFFKALFYLRIYLKCSINYSETSKKGKTHLISYLYLSLMYFIQSIASNWCLADYTVPLDARESRVYAMHTMHALSCILINMFLSTNFLLACVFHAEYSL